MASLCASYLKGTSPEWDALYVDGAGDPCDPATVVATILLPDRTTTLPATVTNEALGEWHVQAPSLTIPGTHVLRVVGSGGGCGATIELSFQIRGSHFP